jgi:hypothetical protein
MDLFLAERAEGKASTIVDVTRYVYNADAYASQDACRSAIQHLEAVGTLPMDVGDTQLDFIPRRVRCG